PLLANIRSLNLEFCSALTLPDVITLLRSPHLHAVQSLHLPTGLITNAVLETLAGCTHLIHLRRLSLGQAYYSAGYSAELLQAVLRAPHLQRLEALALSRLRMTTAHVRALIESPVQRHLQELSLDYCSLGPAEMELLGSANSLEALRFLDLSVNNLGDEGVRLLAGASQLRGLRRLALQRNLIGNAGMIALSQAGPWQQLETLHLGANAIGSAGVEALACSSAFPGLIGIELSGNLMSDEALWNLGRSRQFPMLRVVQLDQVPARREIVEQVQMRFRQAAKPLQGPMPQPSVFAVPAVRPRLSSSHADEDGLLEAIIAAPEDPVPRLIYADWLEEHDEPDRAALLRCSGPPEPALVQRATPSIPSEYAGIVHHVFFDRGLLNVTVQMRGLLTKGFQASGPEWLRRNRVYRLALFGTTRDWSKVAALPMLRQIRMLRLDPGSLKENGLAGLLSSPHLERLFGLEIPRNNLNWPQRLEPLLKATTLPNLCNLNLSNNNLTLPTIRLLATWQPARPLRVLNLSHNWIGAEGLALLVQSEWCRHLTQFNVSHNGLTDRGLQVLIESENLHDLTHLWISGNQITHVGLQALRSSRLLGQLHYLELGSGLFMPQALLEFLRWPDWPPTLRLGVSRYLLRNSEEQAVWEQLGERLILV
ncbi:MAG: TIGR02996 domain-containing protein, partial [Gemmataceae bacterium]